MAMALSLFLLSCAGDPAPQTPEGLCEELDGCDQADCEMVICVESTVSCDVSGYPVALASAEDLSAMEDRCGSERRAGWATHECPAEGDSGSDVTLVYCERSAPF